jgi:tRNA threonylcarbamoyladenosine biosynthesis protein TsaE
MRFLGTELATVLRAGDLVLLSGPLGAGKTTFAQGVGSGLGVVERVLSPTFVLAREHHGGRLPLVHVDAYRLGSLAELDDLDLDTPAQTAVTLVEWGEGLAEPLADGHLEVRIERSDQPLDDTRTVTLIAVGPAWADRHDALARLTSRR